MQFCTNESKFDRINVLKATAEDVWSKIPHEDQDRIESVCDKVVFWDGGSQIAAFSPKDRHIRVYVYDLNRFTIPAQRGILAHEFGHAFDYAQRKVLSTRRDRNKWSEFEKLADEHALRWTFARDLELREKENRQMWPDNERAL